MPKYNKYEIDDKPIEPSISPLDFITPGMLVAPIKGLGSGLLGLVERGMARSAGNRLAQNEARDALKYIADSHLAERSADKALARQKLLGNNPEELNVYQKNLNDALSDKLYSRENYMDLIKNLPKESLSDLPVTEQAVTDYVKNLNFDKFKQIRNALKGK